MNKIFKKEKLELYLSKFVVICFLIFFGMTIKLIINGLLVPGVAVLLKDELTITILFAFAAWISCLISWKLSTVSQ